MTKSGKPRETHPAAKLYARELAQGLIGRREFLTRVTGLGVGVGAAYALGGLGTPAAAQEDLPAAANPSSTCLLYTSDAADE